jgi:crossover junction endodeoxyribonuclease RuvC
MNVIGLDLSLSSTGVASSLGWVDRIKPKTTGLTRMREIVAAIHMFTSTSAIGLVVVEGPSFGSVTGSQHERGGLWWMVVEAIDRRGIPWMQVPPAVLKKYATGRGNAPKDEVLAAAIRRFPESAIRGNDEADALWLAAIGAQLSGEPMCSMPAVNCAGLTKLKLPEGLSR